MNKGKCSVAIAPLRLENCHRSEMVSQLLFGETFEILEFNKEFSKIRTTFDHVEAWVDSLQIELLTDENVLSQSISFIKEPFQEIELKDGVMILPMGAEILDQQYPVTEIQNIRESIITTAKKFLNAPFLWGGKTIFGIDSGALVQMIYKIHSVDLPRTPMQQSQLGTARDFVGEAEAGDIAFFENQLGEIVHAGIILNPYEVIHVADQVRIDSFDFSGIYNAKTKSHHYTLRFIKSIL